MIHTECLHLNKEDRLLKINIAIKTEKKTEDPYICTRERSKT